MLCPLAANFWNSFASKLAVSMLAEAFGSKLAANFEVYLYNLYLKQLLAHMYFPLKSIKIVILQTKLKIWWMMVIGSLEISFISKTGCE